MIITDEKERLLNLWLSHPKFRQLARAELGEPLKEVISWSSGIVKVSGPKGARGFLIETLIEGAQELEKIETEIPSEG